MLPFFCAAAEALTLHGLMLIFLFHREREGLHSLMIYIE